VFCVCSFGWRGGGGGGRGGGREWEKFGGGGGGGGGGVLRPLVIILEMSKGFSLNSVSDSFSETF